MFSVSKSITTIFLHMHTYKFLDLYNIYLFHSCMDILSSRWKILALPKKYNLQLLLALYVKYFLFLPFHKLSELLPSILTCWILCRSLLRWSWIFQSPWPRITAEYIPCVMIGARMLSVWKCRDKRHSNMWVSCLLKLVHCVIYLERLGLAWQGKVLPGSIRNRGREQGVLRGGESRSSSFVVSRTTLQMFTQKMLRVSETAVIDEVKIEYNRSACNRFSIFTLTILSFFQASLIYLIWEKWSKNSARENQIHSDVA